MLVCVLSVAVILPVNFSGDLLGRCIPASGWHKHCTLRLEGERILLSVMVLQGGGGLLGTWEVGGQEEQRGPTGIVCPASMKMLSAPDSHKLLLVLFSCRTQPHSLWPDHHRQHPNTVCNSGIGQLHVQLQCCKHPDVLAVVHCSGAWPT